jgi:GT2 family glycosyltransferase
MYKPEDICFAFVLYQRELTKVNLIDCLIREARKLQTTLTVYIHDNSPSQNVQFSANDISGLPIKGLEIKYIKNGFNVGVSAAYNAAAEFAVEEGKTWLLLLDQDTDFEEGFVQKYINALNKASNRGQRIFAPFLVGRNSHKHLSPCYPLPYFTYAWRRLFKPLHSLTPGCQSLRWYRVFNSGMLLHTSVFSLTTFNPGVFLDFSDFDFLERVMAHTKEFVLLDFQAVHGLSIFETNSLQDSLYRFRLMVASGKVFSSSFGRKWRACNQLIRFAIINTTKHKNPIFFVHLMGFVLKDSEKFPN